MGRFCHYLSRFGFPSLSVFHPCCNLHCSLAYFLLNGYLSKSRAKCSSALFIVSISSSMLVMERVARYGEAFRYSSAKDFKSGKYPSVCHLIRLFRLFCRYWSAKLSGMILILEFSSIWIVLFMGFLLILFIRHLNEAKRQVPEPRERCEVYFRLVGGNRSSGPLADHSLALFDKLW